MAVKDPFPGTRVCTYDRGEIVATFEPANAQGVPVQSRVVAIETQSTSDVAGNNPSVTLGTYDRGNVSINLPSQRPSGASSADQE